VLGEIDPFPDATDEYPRLAVAFSGRALQRVRGPVFWTSPPHGSGQQPDKTQKIDMLRLQLLDNLTPFSGERHVQGLVHIVDDDASFRTAMERRLRRAGYEVAVYASAQPLLDRLPSEGVPSCILLDVRIPELSGPELQERLSELGSTVPIIFLTGHPDVPTTVRAIKAGADDFLTKPIPSDELLHAVERAIAHHEITRGLKSKLDMVRAHIAALTPRERQVFELVIRGNTNKQVARALGGTERTIKAHRHRVMEKMQVQSLAELVSLAERVGVLGGTSGSRQTA
jgi:FixJ family two-component response regulator